MSVLRGEQNKQINNKYKNNQKEILRPFLFLLILLFIRQNYVNYIYIRVFKKVYNINTKIDI